MYVTNLLPDSAFRIRHSAFLLGASTFSPPRRTRYCSGDRILIDAPCSGTGTLRRNPEIRWRITERDIHELAAQQKLFLKNAARVLKPGGQLVYSTCSVERDENEQVIETFERENPEFKLINTRRLWPQHEGTDGFFIASLQLATQQ